MKKSTFLRRAAGFRSDEVGGMTIFVLIIFLLMIMMGGMAVDLMRYEDTRVTLQQTLDRSVLAAAALNQDLVPEVVVADYFEKAGLASQLDRVTVTQSDTSRSVKAKGRVDLNPFFMHIMGIHELPARAVSTAEQGVDNLEISLVLDVSGSMSGNKLVRLKAAAAEFVTTMLQNDPFGRVSISVVPYNAQVNLGAPLRQKFQAVNIHGVLNVDCLELPDASYLTPGVPRNLDLPMMAYADLYSGTNYTDAAVSPTGGSATPSFGNSFCRPNQENIVRLPSQDLTTIVAQINAMTAGGNTSITLGMKWGMTLLDPTMRTAYVDFGNTGVMSPDLSDRPYAYNDSGVQKVVILMTDGEHVPHNRITDPYKTGPSPIYRATDGKYSVYKPTLPGPNKYYVPHTDSFQSTPYSGGGAAVQQNWQQIWATLRVTYVAWQFNGRAMANDSNGQVAAFNDWYYTMVTSWKSRSQMDAMLQTTCGQARANDVLVFGIAFQAPTAGQTQILNCSTNPGYYFDADDGDALQSAFRQIATNLTQLRLTQ